MLSYQLNSSIHPTNHIIDPLYIPSSYCYTGVVVGVSELLLTSLAKMTVQVGKTVGQVVGDSKVCYCIPYCVSHCMLQLPHHRLLTHLK